jgi:hypothetical protein
MTTIILSIALLVGVPLLSLGVAGSDHDDRDRRGWWPGVRVR